MCNRSIQEVLYYRYCVYIFFSARPCPEVPNVTYAQTNDTMHVFNSSVTYTCPDGWEIPERGREVTITCTEDGTWDFTPSLCTGNYRICFV